MEQPSSKEEEPELQGLAPYERQRRDRKESTEAAEQTTLPIKLPNGQISRVKRQAEEEQVSGSYSKHMATQTGQPERCGAGHVYHAV